MRLRSNPTELAPKSTIPSLLLTLAATGTLGCGAGATAPQDLSEQVVSTQSALSISDFLGVIPGTAVGSGPVAGSRELLIVCMDKRTQDPMPSWQDFQTLGVRLQDYFREVSGGRFIISNVMFRGCGGTSGTYRASAVDPPVPQQWTEALNQAAASGFDFRAYDANADNYISEAELAIAVIRQTNPNADYGTARTATFQASGQTMSAFIADVYLTPGTAPVKHGVVGHELMHIYAGAADLNGAQRAGIFSIMDYDGWRNGTHLDPIHKLKYRWANPTLRTLRPQTFFLGPVETTGNITILADGHGAGEYFVIENRSKSASTFDAVLPQEGVVVWRVVEDINLAKQYSPNQQIERWGFQLLTAAPIQPGAGFDLPWLEGPTGYRLTVVSQTGGTAKVTIAPAAGSFSMPVSIPGSNVDFFEAAAEGSTFTVGQSGRYVAFGARDDETKWSYKYLSPGVYTCNPTLMQDLDYGVPKACYFANLRFVVNEEYGSNTCPAGQVCINVNLTGTTSKPATYAFGANGKFRFATFNNSSYRKCSLTTFGGDPTPNVGKACYAMLPGYSYATREGSSTGLTGLNNAPIAFGANGKYAFAVKSGNVTCDAASIGDPGIEGVSRYCYALDQGKSYLGFEGVAFSFDPTNATCAVQYTSGRNGNVSLLSSCSGSCTNQQFGGDPNPWYVKSCYGSRQILIR